MSGASARRLFIAAEVPAAFKSTYESLRGELSRRLPGARWSRPQGIHLTFKFLGSTPEDLLAPLVSAARSTSGACEPFRLITGGPGFFGDRGRPRVLWIALGGQVDAADRLRAALEVACEAVGFEREERTFHPHLTLARFDPVRRTSAPPEILAFVRASLEGIDVPVGSLVLFESVLGPGGSTYVPRETFPMGGARA